MNQRGIRPKAVLFDLDGTLVDTHGLILQCYEYATQTHLQQPMRQELWQQLVGLPLDLVFEALCLHYGTPITPALIDTLKKTYRAHMHDHAGNIRAFPGILEMLTTLRERDLRMAVVTTKNRPMALRHLETAELTDFFAVIVAGDDLKNMKPDPEPFLRALELLELRAEDAVHIGDSQHDIIGAKAAGIYAIAALWGADNKETLLAAGPDHSINDPSEISAIF